MTDEALRPHEVEIAAALAASRHPDDLTPTEEDCRDAFVYAATFMSPEQIVQKDRVDRGTALFAAREYAKHVREIRAKDAARLRFPTLEARTEALNAYWASVCARLGKMPRGYSAIRNRLGALEVFDDDRLRALSDRDIEREPGCGNVTRRKLRHIRAALFEEGPWPPAPEREPDARGKLLAGDAGAAAATVLWIEGEEPMKIGRAFGGASGQRVSQAVTRFIRTYSPKPLPPLCYRDEKRPYAIAAVEAYKASR